MRRTQKPLMLGVAVLTPALMGIPQHAEAAFQKNNMAVLMPLAQTTLERVNIDQMALIEALLTTPLKDKQLIGANRIPQNHTSPMNPMQRTRLQMAAAESKSMVCPSTDNCRKRRLRSRHP